MLEAIKKRVNGYMEEECRFTENVDKLTERSMELVDKFFYGDGLEKYKIYPYGDNSYDKYIFSVYVLGETQLSRKSSVKLDVRVRRFQDEESFREYIKKQNHNYGEKISFRHTVLYDKNEGFYNVIVNMVVYAVGDKLLIDREYNRLYNALLTAYRSVADMEMKNNDAERQFNEAIGLDLNNQERTTFGENLFALCNDKKQNVLIDSCKAAYEINNEYINNIEKLNSYFCGSFLMSELGRFEWLIEVVNRIISKEDDELIKVLFGFAPNVLLSYIETYRNLFTRRFARLIIDIKGEYAKIHDIDKDVNYYKI